MVEVWTIGREDTVSNKQLRSFECWTVDIQPRHIIKCPSVYHIATSCRWLKFGTIGRAGGRSTSVMGGMACVYRGPEVPGRR